jgi:hypothetical protein
MGPPQARNGVLQVTRNDALHSAYHFIYRIHQSQVAVLPSLASKLSER